MSVLFEYCNTGDNLYTGMATSAWRGQTFTPALSHVITSVKLLLYRNDSTDCGTVTVSIRATSGGLPTGSDLCSATKASTTIAVGTPTWYEFTFASPVALGSGVVYAICVRTSAGTQVFHEVRWRYKSSSGYAGGRLILSSNSGSSWSNWEPTSDGMFEEWGEETPTPTTNDASNIATFDALLNGEMSDGGSIDQVGFDYGLATAGYTDEVTESGSWGSGVQTFTRTISPLLSATWYVFRAKIHHSLYGWFYGAAKYLLSLHDDELILYEKNEEVGTVGFNVNGVNWWAQTFTPQISHQLRTFGIKAKRVGSPGTVTISLRAVDTGTGKPTGADIVSATYPGNLISTSVEWIEFNIFGPVLDAGTKYAIIMRAPSGNGSNYVDWQQKTASYSYGAAWGSSDSGSTWGGDQSADANFRDYGGGSVETHDATNIWPTEATGNGFMHWATDITERGFEWGTVGGGGYPNEVTESGTFEAGYFSLQMTGLPYSHVIFYRAKIYHSSLGWLYGNEMSFITPAPIPYLRTDPPSDVDLDHIDAEGYILSIGAENPDTRGFVYGLTSVATKPDETTSPADSGYDGYTEEDGSFSVGAYSGTIWGLQASKVYYVRAWAHNSYGYGYGGEIRIVTNPNVNLLYPSSDYSKGIRFSSNSCGVPGGGSDHYLLVRNMDNVFSTGGYFGWWTGQFVLEKHYYNDNYYTDLYGLTNPFWIKSGMTLAEDINDVVTEFDVNDVDAEVGQIIKIGDEQMEITDVTDSTLTVTREYGGTSAASHDEDDIIFTTHDDIIKVKWKANPISNLYPYGNYKREFFTHATQYTGDIHQCNTLNELVCEVFYTNPNTVAEWTWDETVDLIAGITLGRGAGFGFAGCAYLEVRVLWANAAVRTDAAEVTGSTTATLNGTVLEDEAEECEVYFEWGLTDSYGEETTPEVKAINEAFSADISGLDPTKTYHYRAVVETACGETFYGDDTLFNQANPDRIYAWLGDSAGDEGIELTDPSYPMVLYARTEIGWDEELAQATAGIAEIVCDNFYGDFNPENTGGQYYGDLVLGKWLTVYEVYKGIQYDHFTGRIDKILPSDDPTNPTAYIRAVDGMDDIKGTKVSTALRTDTDVGELAGDILDAVGWPGGTRDIDSGVDTLDAGWFHKKDGLQAFRDLETTEKGRFFIKPGGDARFENRHYRVTGDGLVSQHDFEDTAVRIEYEYSKRLLYNEVIVTGRRYFSGGVQLFTGYDLATVESGLVWSAHTGDAGAPYVPQNSTLVIWAETQSPIYSYDTLVKGTHWNANSEPDKTGDDLSDNITVNETQYGQAVKLEIVNAGGVGCYIVEPDSPPDTGTDDRTLLVYGVLFSAENMTIIEEDATSQSTYGKKTLEIDAPFKSKPNDILAYAQWLLQRYYEPIPTPVQVMHIARTNWPDDTLRIQCLVRHISDRITVKSTKLGFDRDFYINKVVQEYAMNEGGMVHETSWVVEQAEGSAEGLYWLLGVAGFGELGQKTVLGF